jgi:hypothetical protein
MYDVRSASPEKYEAVWDYGIHTARDLEGTIEVGHLLSDANDAQSGEAYANVVRGCRMQSTQSIPGTEY